MVDLKIVAQEIRDILEKRRQEIQLSFIEEGHEYWMLNSNNELRNDFPSVSSVIDEFYEPFDPTKTRAWGECNGDEIKQQLLLETWDNAGSYATNKGSRVHYELEKYQLEKSGLNKIVRQPFYICNEQQMLDSDNMIKAGKEFLALMEKRGCILIDTEAVVGSPNLGYTGQGDNLWLCPTKDGESFGALFTDHKSNKVKNLEPQWYNGYLYSPFNQYISYALTHYYLQLPLYSRLFLDMLKGTKYENIQILGGIIDSLRDDGTFQEYRVPKFFMDTILTMDLTPFIKTKKAKEKNYD
jgi:hypothetical protein